MSGAVETGRPVDEAVRSERNILFLQGPLSPLYKQTGGILKSRGLGVYRINFCAGDWLHWHGDGCTSYKGSVGDWQAFIDRFLDTYGITDLVLHGDQRIYHRLAIECARRRGLYVAVTELGALRPGWMTLERNGLSTVSHFPDDPARVCEIAERVGPIDLSPRFPSSFWLQTAPDVGYNLANVVLMPFFPRYERHTIYPPVEEYLRGAVRLLRQRRRDAHANAVMAQLQEKGTRYFVLPIQLEGDFQLRRHSPFSSFKDVLALVFGSLASSAGKGTELVLKSHPLDVGIENWEGVARALATEHGVSDRVHYLDGGGLAKPFEKAAGVVTLNSTAGLEALQAGVPVKTLVPAHFDIAGLTHQGSLDTFWSQPEVPDEKLLDAYVRALAGTTQVRGSIHNRDGVGVAARNIAERIATRTLNAHGAFVEPPPRLERARKLGVPL
ncbi:capsule biosynthesis protein [Labrenzia sp. VG12]|uniref:capsule biosynthesis protein n=1 Tax=Labrenzia sp. VG12 TaxID=2021862 RepID=UPI000B8C179D|nr:capsular biosynthesis protein [Labrenzia sp. VG12]ASP32533.1 capsular biosynthesis protein [Labrenzia sp. VG12]